MLRLFPNVSEVWLIIIDKNKNNYKIWGRCGRWGQTKKKSSYQAVLPDNRPSENTSSLQM